MRPGVGFLEGVDGHFGVNLRGVEPGVAEELLDQADVGPFSSMWVAQLWRKRWQLPRLPMSAALTVLVTQLPT